MTAEIATYRQRIAAAAEAYGAPIRLMEVCGTHTVAIFRQGIRSLLPATIKLISGPGCPVCVTSQGFIDTAVGLASRPNTIVVTYGDMVRVPGQRGSLEQARAEGARVEVVLSARDALKVARDNPDTEVVFIAVGFETTAPATADAVLVARQAGVANFSVLAAHKTVVPGIMALLGSGQVAVDGFLCPGHVSVVVGSDVYRPIVERYQRGCVVTGFEPAQILGALADLTEMIGQGLANLVNDYTVVVRAEGNVRALALMARVFEPGDATWRGLGCIEGSGLQLRSTYKDFDALERFGLDLVEGVEVSGCRCGDVIRGVIDPPECPLFDRVCRPVNPIGPCMVSSEGSCQAWWKYHRVAV